jgi:hypothetical protein
MVYSGVRIFNWYYSSSIPRDLQYLSQGLGLPWINNRPTPEEAYPLGGWPLHIFSCHGRYELLIISILKRLRDSSRFASETERRFQK